MYLIDTNVFLEILMQQERSENCKKLLEKVAESDMNCLVSSFTVNGVEGMLIDELEALDKFMTNITSLVNLDVVKTSIEEEKHIIELAKSGNLDFDNALQYSVAKRENAEAIISFDSDFDKTDLERKEPEEII